MRSMTGFGYAETEDAGIQLSVEIKTYNTRYLDLAVNLPSPLSPLEPRLREALQGRFSRGRIELNVRMREFEEDLVVRVDTGALRAWREAFAALSEELGTGEQPTLDLLARQEGVLKSERRRDLETIGNLAAELVAQAAKQVAEDRQREGIALTDDIDGSLRDIETHLEVILALAPKIRTQVEGGLRTRFKEVLGEEAEENRILLETAAWIAKTDINEEIVRLRTHIEAFREISGLGEPVGKKLDFLAQEMGREINTIGSKSPVAEVSGAVVSMKDALERIREQLRNVE